MKYKQACKHALLTKKVLNYPKDVNLTLYKNKVAKKKKKKLNGFAYVCMGVL